MWNYNLFFREQFVKFYLQQRAKGLSVRFTTNVPPMNCDQIRKLYHAAVGANLCTSDYLDAGESDLTQAIEANISLRLFPATNGGDWRLDYVTNPADDPLSWDAIPPWAADDDSDSDPDNEWDVSREDRDKMREELEPERALAAWRAYVLPVVDPFEPTATAFGDGLDYLFCVRR
jgi:hypothetical protein